MYLTTFASGSGGNCALLRIDGVNLLLDAGISFRRIKENLALTGLRPEDLTAVLISHTHSDHVSGLPMLLKHCRPIICAPRIVANQLCVTVAGVEQCLRVLPAGEEGELQGLRIRCFHTSHDTAESVGWRVTGSRSCFAVATDLGCVSDEVRTGLLGAKLVLLEANHDPELLRTGPYPPALKRRILSDRGHLSNACCGDLAAELARHGTRTVLLGHLSKENNRPALALETVLAALNGAAEVYVAPPDRPMTLVTEEEQPCFA